MVWTSRSSQQNAAIGAKPSLPDKRDASSGAGACETLVTVERRNAVDRRGGLWRAFMYGNFRPRRRSHRRQTDAHFHWFDWHEPRVLYLALGILLLSCTDALFTLNLLNAGAGEANLVMDAMLSIGMDQFVIGKILLTSCSVVMLVGVARRSFYGPFSVEHLLQTVFFGYVLLICYELYMFWYVFDLSISPAWLQLWFVSG